MVGVAGVINAATGGFRHVARNAVGVIGLLAGLGVVTGLATIVEVRCGVGRLGMGIVASGAGQGLVIGKAALAE